MEDQSAPIPKERTSKLGGNIEMDDGRSMRAVKNNLPTPSGEVEESEALVGRAQFKERLRPPLLEGGGREGDRLALMKEM